MSLSNIFSSTALSKMAQRLGLEPPHKDRPAWSYGTHYKEGVDARLTGILSAAAERFARENPGYTVEATSGKNARKSGTQWHPGGIATDVQIMDPTGKKLGNYRDAKSFRTYEKFAQTAKAVQHETYPELDSHFAWGGYYGGRFAADQMHFDLGPTRGSLGTWEGGLNKAGRNFLPGAESIGIGEISRQQLADVPTPTARPDPRDPANMDPDPAFGSLGPMFASLQHPNLAAPVGQVQRAHLAEALKAAPISAVDAAPPAPSIAPHDVARQAVNAPVDAMGGLGSSLARNAVGLATQKGKGALASLPPDRQMPNKSPMSMATLGGIVGSMAGPAPNAAPASPMRPDNVSYAGPKGAFAVSPAEAQPTPADVAPASPVRPDNLNAAGPKGMFNVAPNLMSPDAMAPAPALSPPTDVQEHVIAPMTQTPAPAAVAQPAAVRQRVAAPAAQPAAPARQAPSMPSLDKDIAGVSPSEAFGVGSIADAIGGPRGAFAMSRSTPGTGVINRGPLGTATFNSTGAVTPVGPSGDIRANRDTMKAWGRVLGSIFDSEKDKAGKTSSGGFSSSSSGRGRGAFGAAGGRLGQSQHSL